MNRRSFLTTAGLTTAAAATWNRPAFAQSRPPLKGRLKQAATKGCFGRGASIEFIAREASRLGLKGIDLSRPDDWPVLKEHGLLPTMVSGAGGIGVGINRKEQHDKFEQDMRENITRAAANGFPNVITLSGERRGMSDEEGAENCAIFLNRVKTIAEDKGVTINLELLNSKVNHPDYMCDHTKWGVEVMKAVNSPRVKLLYDIYHMQIMEGDIIRTIKENIQYFGHFHTAGNPGRHEIGPTQELNYRAIAQAIVDTGFTGYLAHEYSPLGDPVAGMEEAIRICDV
jgi:hydroxypyruvate isomerase